MKSIYFFLLLMTHPFIAFAEETIAVSMVPRGKLVETLGRDFIIKTKAGTKIGIEFQRNGQLEEAKGVNLNKGDELEPGDGLLSLSSIAQILQSTGIKPQGNWLLEKDRQMGWVYEVENTVISAKTGKIIKTKQASN